ncbi:MAG: PQQ-dependent sugar dehydrogenase [Deltaproteobacteria bacterium]
MSHLLRTRSFAAVSLVLVGAGLIAVACGSDNRNPSVATGDPNDTSTNSNLPNMPDNGGPANPPDTSGNPPVSNNPPNGTGNEGPMGNIPIEQNPPETPPGQMGNPPVSPDPVVPITANCEPAQGAAPTLTLQPLGNFNQPIYVTGVPGDDSRLAVMEKAGAIRVLVNDQLQQAPFIDVSSMVANNGEMGLLGLAFHPDYATNGLFYLHFSSNASQGLPASGDTVVAEFTANADRSAADPATRRIILTTAGLEANHNGGQLAFGPDKLLYFGLGDGGGGNDQHGTAGNGQALNTLNAKILRLDPLGRGVNNAYSIPAGNLAAPAGQQARPEIWAYGLRNPWRFSFDACNGDLYIGDVGQNTLEEIDYLPAAADRTIASGANFGWRLMEGPNCRPGDTNCNQQTQAQMGLKLPVDSYARAVGQSVTGGYVYRGSAIPGLRGTYIYADYASARFFSFRIENGAIAGRAEITDQMRPATGAIDNIASFGTDNAGEMYVAAFTPGTVYRVAAAP